MFDSRKIKNALFSLHERSNKMEYLNKNTFIINLMKSSVFH